MALLIMVPFRLLVLVHSATQNAEARRIVRKTWGKGFLSLPGVKLFFIVGVPPPGITHNGVKAEDIQVLLT